ncbi:flagellar protein FlaG [Sulfurimonas sp. HSL-1716]|uniref:flagellar protein FlaG n=1 Tax=Hydrocurvibacter sulfurireducens TaxID=3131937 RepID=UPI0031F725FE
MDGLQNVARQQVSQMSNPNAQGRAAAEQTQQSTVVQQMQNEDMHPTKKITSQDEVNDLVKKMNDALSPFNTSIKFGVDKQDTFYVSVVDTQSQKMIRRFPVEQATEFLPKMKELTGIIFDTKG